MVAQPHHSEHEHQGKRTEQVGLDQQESNDAYQRCTLQQNRHEKHEWVNQTECKSYYQTTGRQTKTDQEKT